MKNNIIIILLIVLLNGCTLFDTFWGSDATGVIVYINDGTGAYGLDGTYRDGSKKYKRKFRLVNFSRYNNAVYEGDTVTIDNCWVDEFSDEPWETILEEPFNM